MSNSISTATIWVMKFGGTSVATPDLMKNAVKRIAARRAEGHRVVVVVSAMGKTTDRLLELASALSPSPPRRELDVLMSAGEVQSMALLSIALEAEGIPAISFSGRQGGIRTDDRYSQARIVSIDPSRIHRELEQDRVVVVAGFQGENERQDVTTLGRGGSDTSAVAIAAALGARGCEILTDVDGVYTADPRVVPNARRIERLSSDEMLEMATLGARVLHGRSVELARRFDVPLVVASSTRNAPGTRIEPPAEEQKMEQVVVRAITDDPAVHKVSLVHVPDQPGVAAKVFEVLGAANIAVRLIVQAQSYERHNDITLLLPADAALDEGLLQQVVAAVGGESWVLDEDVALLSVVGEGIAREPGIAATIFRTLAAEGINIDVISTSNLVISCVVPESSLAPAARALHAALVETE
ncbi:MAG: aspartate kinase [Planctomycetota bacterium]|jgi:aspartate kinase